MVVQHTKFSLKSSNFQGERVFWVKLGNELREESLVCQVFVLEGWDSILGKHRNELAEGRGSPTQNAPYSVFCVMLTTF